MGGIDDGSGGGGEAVGGGGGEAVVVVVGGEAVVGGEVVGGGDGGGNPGGAIRGGGGGGLRIWATPVQIAIGVPIGSMPRLLPAVEEFNTATNALYPDSMLARGLDEFEAGGGGDSTGGGGEVDEEFTAAATAGSTTMGMDGSVVVLTVTSCSAATVRFLSGSMPIVTSVEPATILAI